LGVSVELPLQQVGVGYGVEGFGFGGECPAAIAARLSSRCSESLQLEPLRKLDQAFAPLQLESLVKGSASAIGLGVRS